MNTNKQAPDCCPFCGAGMIGSRSTDGEYARYKCGNAFDARNDSTREMQSKHCADAERNRLSAELEYALARLSESTAERERLTRERDEAKRKRDDQTKEIYAYVQSIHELKAEREQLLTRVRRLEVAGDAIVDHNIGCGCGQDGPCRACRMACEAWTKAKEATP